MKHRREVFILFIWILTAVSASDIGVPNSNDSSWIWEEHSGRLKRNADNMQLLLDATAPFARISNAISLQTGLLDASIPIDDAIAELLNLGPLKLSDVHAFKPDDVNTFANKLTQSPLDDSQETLNSENRILKLKSEGVKLEVTQVMRDYFEKVKSFASGFDFNKLGEITKAIVDLKDILKKVEGIPENNISANNVAEFSNLHGGLAAIETNAPKAQEIHNGWKAHEALKSGKEVLKPLETVVNSMRARTQPEKLSDKVRANLNTLLELASLSNTVTNHLSFLETLAKSRGHPHNSHRPNTPGFPNGLLDMDSLRQDLVNEKLGRFFNGTFQRLANGLKPILSAQYKLGEVDKQLSSLPDQYPSIKTVKKLHSNLNGVSISKQDAEKVLDVFDAATSTVIPATVYQPIITLLKEVDTLSTAISSLEEFTRYILSEEFKKSINDFVGHLSFENIGDLTKLQQQIPGFRKKLRETKALEIFQKVIDDTVKSIPKTDELKTSAGAVVQTPLDAFIKAPEVAKEVTSLENLGKLGKNVEQVSMAIQSIRNLRELRSNPKHLNDLKSVATTVSTASGNLQKLKPTILEEMKAMKSSDIQDLGNLKNTFNDFKIVGICVLGIHKMQDFRKAMVGLKMVDTKVQAELSSVPNQKIQWGDLKTLEAGLKKIEASSGKLKVAEAKTLSDFGALFKNFESIEDVAFDGTEKLKALDMLAPVVKDQNLIKSAEESVEAMDSLDLQFSKYQSSFSGAPLAMKNFQDSLATFLNPVLESSTSDVGVADEVSDIEKFLRESLLVIIIVVAVIVLAIIAILYCFCCGGMEKWKNGKNSDDKKPDDAELGAGSTNTPAAPPQEEKKETKAPTSQKPVEDVKKDVEDKEKEVKPVEQKEERKQKSEPKKKEEEKSKSKKAKVDEKKKKQKKKKSKSKSSSTGSKVQEPEPPAQYEAQDSATMKGEGLKHLADKPDAEKVNQWCMDNADGETDKLYRITRSGLANLDRTGDFEKEALAFLPREKHQNLELAPCNPHNAPNIFLGKEKFPYQSTSIPTREKKNVVIAQGPLAENKALGHVDTREDFWTMAMELKPNCIVMIGKYIENDKPMCAEYFKEAKDQVVGCGKWLITTLEVFEGIPDIAGTASEVTTRRLRVADKDDDSMVEILHYQYHSWPQMGIPASNPTTLVKLSDHVHASEKAVIVHSTLGHRAVAFAMIRLGSEFVENFPDKIFCDILKWIRMFRWRATLTIRQCLYVTLCIVNKIFTEYVGNQTEFGSAKEWKEYEKWCRKVQSMNTKLPYLEEKREKDANGNPVPESNGAIVYY